MKALTDYLRGPIPWVDSSVSGDLFSRVICANVKAFRNLRLFPFLTVASREHLSEISGILREFCETIKFGSLLPCLDLSGEHISALQERFLLPPGINFHGSRGEEDYANSMIILGNDSELSAAVNLQEHFTITSYGNISSLEERMNKLNKIIERQNWCTDPSLGYLNSDPALTGAAVRISALVHFPGVYLRRQTEQLINALKGIGLKGTGYGDLTGKAGMIWVSSMGTIRQSESELIQNFKIRIKECLKIEKKMENELLEKDRGRLEDKIYRSLYLLLGARRLETPEFLELSSWVKLGGYLNIIKKDILKPLDELLVRSGAGHISAGSGNSKAASQILTARAEMVASKLRKCGKFV